MELIQLAISIPLLMPAWRAWRVSVIDHGRDTLGDLRDGPLRHASQSGQMGALEYQLLHERINDAIRRLPGASVLRLFQRDKLDPQLQRIQEQRAELGTTTPPLSMVGQNIEHQLDQQVIKRTLLMSAVGCLPVLVLQGVNRWPKPTGIRRGFVDRSERQHGWPDAWIASRSATLCRLPTRCLDILRTRIA